MNVRADAGLVFAFALTLALGYLAANEWSVAQATPLPATHDEFANLLGAETFLHGRLTNPSPPVWQSFQTFHVLTQPTYAPKYPPGNSALLALGLRLAGSPIVAVWFAYAIGCALVTWAAQPFVGRQWALAGGLATALVIAPTYWVSSYWGGALAFVGGALLLGAVRRLWDRPSRGVGLALASGIAVLATTRPYEGFLLCAASVVALTWRGWRSSERDRYVRAAVPAVVTLAVFGIVMMGLNRAVTGSALTLAYVEYDRQYGIPPAWVFKAPRAVSEAPFREMQTFLDWAVLPYRQQSSWDGLMLAIGKKLETFSRFFLPHGLWMVLLGLPLCAGDRWIRGLLTVVSVSALAVLAVVWVHPHYAAPLLAPLVVIILATAQRLSRVRLGAHRIGALFVLLVAARWFLLASQSYANTLSYSGPQYRPKWTRVREQMRTKLSSEASGAHVVIVRYTTGHVVHEDWVYNGADLENAPVLFARDLGPTQNAKLIAHFPRRNIWVAKVGADPKAVTLEPYAVP